MKKLLALSLSVLLLFGTLCACGSDDTATPDESTTPVNTTAPSAQEAVQMYLDNSSVWDITTNEAKWLSALFLDLDFDSTLELVVTSVSTSDYSLVDYKFYKLDAETNSISEIPYPGKEKSADWDFGGDYPQLYRDNSTGEYKYLVYDNTRDSNTNGVMCIGELTLDSSSNICTSPLWSFTYSVSGYSDTADSEFHYYTFDKDGNKEEVDEETYDSTLNSYEQNNTNLNLTFKLVESNTIEYTYSDLTAEEKFDMLLEAYNAFSYSK